MCNCKTNGKGITRRLARHSISQCVFADLYTQCISAYNYNKTLEIYLFLTISYIWICVCMYIKQKCLFTGTQMCISISDSIEKIYAYIYGDTFFISTIADYLFVKCVCVVLLLLYNWLGFFNLFFLSLLP